MSEIVITLGGNALQSKNSKPTSEGQLEVVRHAYERLAEISAQSCEMSIIHGNDPQMGGILLAFEVARNVTPTMPFGVYGATSRGYIGYHIQQALKYALGIRNKHYPVMTTTTQLVVDKGDKTFENPTKPIDSFYTGEETRQLIQEKGYVIEGDAGRGWHRMVASPTPRKIVEIDVIRNLWRPTIVISCGGGGVPVVENPDGTPEGVATVIGKDFTAELLTEQVDADTMMVLIKVERVAMDWDKLNQRSLDKMSLKEAARYVEEGQFAPGNILPKVGACMKFVHQNPQKKAIITSLNKALEAPERKTGTVVTFA